MKHGDKAKKSAKASGKEASRKVAPKGSKASASKQASPKAAAPKGVSAAKPKLPPAGNGKNIARLAPVSVGFSNPVIANAFKRAIKKYATAFKRLTD